MSGLDIRKVQVLKDRARGEAEEMDLDDGDLVLVETKIQKDRAPKYDLTLIDGSPTEFLKEKILDKEEGE